MDLNFKKPILAWASDSPALPFVGNSRVAREFGHRLKSAYELWSIGFNHHSIPNCKQLEAWPTHNVDRMHNTGVNKDQFLDAMQKINPNVLVVSHDVFIFTFLKDVRAQFPNCKIIGYFTIDGSPIPEYYRSYVFDFCDRILVTSKYGVEVVKNHFYCNDVYWVEHGVNINLFGCDDKVLARQRLELDLEAREEPPFFIDGKEIIFLHVGHNQERKATFRFLRAWHEWQTYSKNADKAVLLALIHSRAAAESNGVISQADYDLAEFDVTPNLFISNGPFKDEEIAALYKASDFLLHPATNEGFGLTLIEALASRTTPVVCLYSALTDFCSKQNSIPINFELDAHPLYNTRRAHASVRDIFNAINTAVDIFYSNPKKLQNKRDHGADEAKKFSWDIAAHKFHEHIQRTLFRLPKKTLAYYA